MIHFHVSGVRLSHQWKWVNMLIDLVTLSEVRFKDAKAELRVQNPFCYDERLNPSLDTGIGDLRECMR